MTNPQSSHKIKKRETPKDVFITPRDLAKEHIEFIPVKNKEELWLDPCRYNEEGSYFSQYPQRLIKRNNKTFKMKHHWCEITEGKSFFDYEGKPDVICCNPPYSIMNEWIEKCIELKPRVISFLMANHGLTARRMEMFEKAGYGLSKMRLLKVWSWYGMSAMVVFEKDKESIFSIDRKVWRTE